MDMQMWMWMQNGYGEMYGWKKSTVLMLMLMLLSLSHSSTTTLVVVQGDLPPTPPSKRLLRHAATPLHHRLPHRNGYCPPGLIIPADTHEPFVPQLQ